MIEIAPLLVVFLLLFLVIVIVNLFGVILLKSPFITCVELAFWFVDHSIAFRSQIVRWESGLLLEEKEPDGG